MAREFGVTDLEVFLRSLPRPGTGQHLTTYQSILTDAASITPY